MKPGDLLLMRTPFGNFLVYFISEHFFSDCFFGCRLHKYVLGTFYKSQIVANCTNLFENRF